MSNESIAFSKPDIDEDDIDAVAAVLRSGWITTGQESVAFESELGAFLGAEHVVTTSSCTSAEEIVLAHLALPDGSLVAVPTWTFASTALGVTRAGCTPVLVDVDPATLNLCPESLERAMTLGLSAVVGVHFGGVAMAPEVRKLCADADIALVEDAAHALGASDDRGLIAGSGTAGACFSFYATKNLSTAEGGAIATDSADLADFARRYRLHGMSAQAIDRYRNGGFHGYDVDVPGIKANMPDVLAALGRSQLRRFAQSQQRRRELVNLYRELLDTADVEIIPAAQRHDSADHLMVIALREQCCRDRVFDALTAANIGASVHFRPLHTFSWFTEQATPVAPGGLPVADNMHGRTMSLPLHLNLTNADVARVCEVVTGALSGCAAEPDRCVALKV